MTDDAILQARQELRSADRAAAAPYLNYPAEPGWLPAAFGVWAAALVAAYGLFADTVALLLGSIAVLIAVELVAIRVLARRHGALPLPGHGTPPPEIRAVQRRFAAGFVAVLAAVVGTYLLAPWGVAAAVAFVLVAAGYAAYARAYFRAADATRKRLA